LPGYASGVGRRAEGLADMKGLSMLGSRIRRRARKLGTASAVGVTVMGLGAVSGCLNRPIEPIEPVTTSTVVERLTQSAVNKIDLLFMVDNSASMADKEAVLATAVPDLIGGLVNPPCDDDTTGLPIPTAMQPAGPTEACPGTSKREFTPIFDIHIGLISSSLGTFGANGCPDTEPTCPNNAPNTSNNDHGHLVTRTDPCASTVVPTYTTSNGPEGFLAWDPEQMLTPKGIADEPTLQMDLTDLVVGDGQSGCGFESQNEAWYRFLIDPSPYQSITLNSKPEVVTTGEDEVLLQQRREFLRSDSLLAIIVLTDETDTSIKEYGQYPLFAQETNPNMTPFHLPHGSAACTDPMQGPTSACCYSCGETKPAACPVDPTCNGAAGDYNDNTENLGLRAFGLSGGLQSHKARYGIEWFYQPSRYVQALTSPMVQNAAGDMVNNPIFSPNPDEPNASVRDPGLVFYAAITGVPWQLIARQDANGTPDLINGIDPLDKTVTGGFKTYEELNMLDKGGKNTFWQDIAGDPENYVVPFSPYMVESTVPRTGTDPITGTTLAPPQANCGMLAPNPNTINGHEWNVAPPNAPPGDIEYACIFTLPTARDCSLPNAVSCNCTGLAANADNPLCDPNPNDSMNPTLQTRAKAYPGVKNLAIAQGLTTQGIAASICPAQLANPNNADGSPAADYGYRPAVNAIINRLKQALTGECLPRTLTPDPTGQVPCLILEARNVGGGACNCDAADARQDVQTAHLPAEQAAKQDPLDETAQWNCFCEIVQSGSPPPADTPPPVPTAADVAADLSACQGSAADPPINTLTGKPVNGWCYVDDSSSTPIGNPAIVKNCPDTEKRLIRFVGEGQPQTGATLFITCEGQ
jgi:hypothetical protein